MKNGHEPATKADADSQANPLCQAIRDMETKLLRAFYDFAETNQ